MEITRIHSDTPVSLATTLADNLAGLQSVTLAYKRRGAGYRDFACLHLQTEDGAPPKHNQYPASGADEIASTCLQQAQEQADTLGYPTHVRASFKLSVAGNGRARKSPAPVTWPVTVDGSEPVEGVDPIERDKVYTLLRDIAKDNNEHTIKLVDKVCALVDNLGSVGKVLEGAAQFYAEGHRVYREGVDAQADQAFTQATLEADVKKWEAIANSLGPGAGLLFKQIHATMERRATNQGGPVQPQAPRQLQPAKPETFTPMPQATPLRGAATILRELIESLSKQQRDAITSGREVDALEPDHPAKHLFTPYPDTPEGDAGAGGAFAAFVSGTPSIILAKVYEELEPAQVGLLTELQESVL